MGVSPALPNLRRRVKFNPRQFQHPAKRTVQRYAISLVAVVQYASNNQVVEGWQIEQYVAFPSGFRSV
jgi:hypothetical protein